MPKGTIAPGKLFPQTQGKPPVPMNGLTRLPNSSGVSLRLQLAWPGTDDLAVFQEHAPQQTQPP